MGSPTLIVTVEELASALIRGGFFFPSQRDEAVTAAEDLFRIIESNDPEYPGGTWRPGHP